MSEDLTIRERIERRIAAIVAAITDLGEVHRQIWDADDLIERDAYMTVESEESEPAGLGSPANATTLCPLRLSVGVCLRVSQEDRESGETPGNVHNRWIGKLKAALMADPDLLDDDANTEPLSNAGSGVRIVSTNEPPIVSDQSKFMAVVVLEVPYQHYENTPYAGPAVTLRTA